MSVHACFEAMNARLKPHNAKISHGFKCSLQTGAVEFSYYVSTEKLDTSLRSKKPPLVVMTHCPFCGAELKTVKS